MALTLLEQSKLHQGTEVEQAVIEIFARSTPILGILPFRNISGNAFRYSREKTLPGVAFRGINEGYTPSTGVVNPLFESLAIIGGDIEVDNFILQTESNDVRAVHEAMKIKAIAEDWQSSFFSGDSESDPREIDGLQKRIVGTQIVTDSANSSGGDAPSLEYLDELIDKVMNPTDLLMNKSLARRLSAAARNTSVGGYVTYEKDEFGKRIMMYNDLPIRVIEDSEGEDTVLPFTEANPGGGTAASSSIYCVSMGPGMLEGIQNGGMDVRDLGETEDKPVVKTRIEWYAGLTIQHGRAAARYRGIKDAAWTV
ncbi:MAG: hypothetical protein CMJ75_18615 [Planctomycetaceae bacterium]|nr:hypothetical protein [Planctomycetaceae bacterium]